MSPLTCQCTDGFYVKWSVTSLYFGLCIVSKVVMYNGKVKDSCLRNQEPEGDEAAGSLNSLNKLILSPRSWLLVSLLYKRIVSCRPSEFGGEIHISIWQDFHAIGALGCPKNAMKNLAFDFSDETKPLVLDVETQYLSHEVAGGWNAVHRFKVALAVTWDQENGIRIWYEADVPHLLQELDKFKPIVTFNGEGFDFKVLSAYGSIDFLYQKSTDLLAILIKEIGFRVKLESVAQATLGRGKSGTGTESVEWWRSGDPQLRQKVIDYCTLDVELTRDIYLHARKHGFVNINDLKRGTSRMVKLSL